MDNVGAAIWERIVEGYSSQSILELITLKYNVEQEVAKTDFLNLLQQLQEEELVILSENNPHLAQETNEEKNYMTPKLNIYKEMKDLLALDPPVPGINDVWKDK